MRNLAISAGIFFAASGMAYADPPKEKDVEAYILTYPLTPKLLTRQEIEAKMNEEHERQKIEMARYCEGNRIATPPIFTLRF